MIILLLLLVLSVGLNVFLVVYLRWILKKLAFLSENIGDLLSSMNSFSKHVESIHNLETFYGEPVLKNLIEHSKQIVQDIEVYEEIYTLFNENDEEFLNMIEDEFNAEQENEEDEET